MNYKIFAYNVYNFCTAAPLQSHIALSSIWHLDNMGMALVLFLY